ncbi:MAG: leucine--tRNA ligase [Candidatus Saccharibacteria bacterium]|nr:leucine--tRNA ligase [Candidatus Saccharibacteria bacterium]
MKRYNPSDIEPKWQSFWADQKTFVADNNSPRQKFYISAMFPYPSGAGMHTGHAFEHAIVDAIARFQRAHGKNVLNPMGWDTFGLPAENYAIKTGTAPAEVTKVNIANFKNQLNRLGASIDWSREINTTDPEYYRWTQWIFARFFERGLAYQKESLQWWCPVDKTVLANEQVESGKCWRCGTEVVKKSMNQWFFKITDYADALLDEIPDLDWPAKIKTAQTNWIGKSVGAEIEFTVDGVDAVITVFSTRPDTLFGATFLVLAPEHPLAKQLAANKFKQNVEEYIADAVKKSEIERMSDNKEKTGVFTGSYAINPANGEKMQVWIADYVLSGYGTGAIMAVPAHDERDFAFAEKYHLPVVEVIDKPDDEPGVYRGEGVLMNSGVFDGRSSSDIREEIAAWLEEEKIGRPKVTFKMRDWLISRQRYWGAPIPIIHCQTHGAVAVPDDQLPVVLPEIADYAPKGDGKSVLAGISGWVNTTCPTCGEPAKRETDTMDGYACSSWYLLRYTDPNNSNQAWDPVITNAWSPVDYYVGGDHAVAHLLYVRFWTHVFNDMGLTEFKEPVKKLVYHGYINAEDGSKMSKSKGNTIDPLEVIDQGYGADALRTYLLFMGPIELDAPWDSRGIAGIYRFLNRVWVLNQEYLEAEKSFTTNDDAVRRLQHKTIRKVTEDHHRLSFNTAISALMEYVNELYKFKVDGFSDDVWCDALGTLARLLAPFAPHMTAEIWQQLGNSSSIEEAGWPQWDSALIVSDTLTIIVQVNGKLRAKLTVAADTTADDVKQQAIDEPNVVKFLENKEPAKVIYIPGRLVSIVV